MGGGGRATARGAGVLIAPSRDEDIAYDFSDPAEEAERLEQVAQRVAESAPLIAELRGVGLSLDTLGDLINRTDLPADAYARAVPILVEWLGKFSDLAVKEAIVRGLAARPAKAVARARLIEEFKDLTFPEHYRWVVGNTLALLGDADVYSAYRELATDPRYGFARAEVIGSLGRIGGDAAADVLEGLKRDPEVGGHAKAALRDIRRRRR